MQPGCYGSPVCVSATSPSCRVCPAVGGCLASASQLLAALPDTAFTRAHRQALQVVSLVLRPAPRVGQGTTPMRAVSESTRGVRRVSLTEAEQKLIGGLTARVAGQVKSLLERGWFAFARSELNAGRNPAIKGWRHVLCAQLLRGPTSRADLQLAFAQQLNLTPASAKVQASASVAIFTAGKLVQVQESIIMLSQH